MTFEKEKGLVFTERHHKFDPGSKSDSEETDVATAEFNLGMGYFRATFEEDNYMIAFRWIHRSANHGHMEAQFRLGELYSLGQGTKQNHVDAYKWYTKAAIQGYKKALIRIHNLYQEDYMIHRRVQLNIDESNDQSATTTTITTATTATADAVPIFNGAIEYYTSQFKTCCQQSHLDDGITQQILGFLYQHGYGVKKYTKLAIEFYTKAAEKGFTDAQYNLGQIYQKSTDIKFHYRKAFYWYTEAAQNGSAAAQNNLAYFYEKGLSTEVNYEEAIKWYTQAAAQSNMSAQVTLGRIYRKGIEKHVNQNTTTAMKWYRLAAKQGSGVAQNCLNLLSQKDVVNDFDKDTQDITSKPSSKNFLKKVILCSKLRLDISVLDESPLKEHLKKLAKQALVGDGAAMYEIGLKYYGGVDFVKDKDVALRWIFKAAKSKFVKALNFVANLYQEGNDVEQDYLKASMWYTQGVKQNDKVAQYNMGILFKNGRGVQKSTREAIKCFTKSAAQGQVDAQYQLRNLYETKRFTDQNISEASKYYYMAANSANSADPAIQYLMALKYLSGNTVSQDYFKAFDLFKSAAENEYMDAKKLFGTPIKVDEAKAIDYSQVVAMFKLATKNGQKHPPLPLTYTTTIDFNIGYIYEFGIKNDKSTHVFEQSFDEAKQWYYNGAVKGDPRAQFRLGIMYQEGKGGDQDIQASFNYYSKAHEKGVVGATYRLACLYLIGSGISQNYTKAFELFTEASDRGHEKSRINLKLPTDKENFSSTLEDFDRDDSVYIEYNIIISMLEAVAKSGNVAVQYRLGALFEKSEVSRALEWYEMAAQEGMADACYRLGVLYMKCQNIRQANPRVIDLFQKAAKKDHDGALYQLGEIYLYGKGVKCDYIKAYEFYTRAAEQGNALAYDILDMLGNSTMLSDEKGSRKLPDTSSNEFRHSLSMFEFVAENGSAELQYKLGLLYESNKTVLDHTKAIKWFEKAAEESHKNALYRLGMIYESGEFTTKSYQKSALLYEKAKNQGNSDAIYRLAILYLNGNVVNKDPSQVIGYYKDAAGKDSSKLQYALGVLYENGDIVQKDILEALKWYTKAYLQGDDESASKLYNMYSDSQYGSEFYSKLFHILSVFDKNNRNSTPDSQQDYGYMYYTLGTLYLFGLGTKKDLNNAFKYLFIACDIYRFEDREKLITLGLNTKDSKGKSKLLQILNALYNARQELDKNQQYKLGMLYYYGLTAPTDSLSQSLIDLVENSNRPMKADKSTEAIIEQDPSKAFVFFALSGIQNHAEALAKLGDMYLSGQGAEQDYDFAMSLYKFSAEKMDKYRNYELGVKLHDQGGANNEASIIYLTKAAENNHTDAQRYLGDMHYYGYGVGLDYNKAIKWYRQYIIDFKDNYNAQMDLNDEYILNDSVTSSYKNKPYRKTTDNDNLDETEIYELGNTYYNGKGVEKDYETALIYYKIAADQGNVDAQSKLGLMHLNGQGIEKNNAEAMKWFQQTANKLSPSECYDKGIKFYEGLEFDRNYEVSLIYLHKAAEKKYGQALVQLGVMYLKGDGVEKNVTKAMDLFEESLQVMSPSECYEQGLKFYNGSGVDVNYDISLMYLQKAEKRNHAETLEHLIKMLLQGDRVEKNIDEALKSNAKSDKQMPPDLCYDKGMEFYKDRHYEEAITYLREAANMDHSEAQYQLGMMYLQGDGVEVNSDEATKWIQQSVNGMDPEKCYKLGRMFYEGTNKAAGQNLKYAFIFYQKAFEWYTNKAEKGHSESQLKVGFMYLQGLGVESNFTEGTRWLELYSREMTSYQLYERGMNFFVGDKYGKSYETSVFFLKKASELGNSSAQAQLGDMYLRGLGTDANYEEAIKMYESSTNEMSDYYCYERALKFYIGNGVTQSYEISFLYMKKAAEKGHNEAKSKVGEMFIQGRGVESDKDKATNWFKLYTERMDGYACYERGITYYDGDGVEQNHEIALIYLTFAAEKEYSESYAKLGDMYLQGDGTDKNFDKAISYFELYTKGMSSDKLYDFGERYYRTSEDNINQKVSLIYFKKAADQDQGLAQARLAEMYLLGLEVEENEDEAIKLFEASTRNMDKYDMFDLGERFFDGNEVKQNYKVAAIYFKTAAEEENDQAQAKLGDMYYYGYGVEQNYTEAIKWHERSLEGIDPSDCYDLGSKYYSDLDDPNYQIAFVYYKQAAEGGYDAAQNALGDMYLHGHGVEKNTTEALKWIKNAAKSSPSTYSYKLGEMYHASQGIQDFPKALEAYKKAKGSKKSYALRGIGVLYEYGDGVDQDYQKAFDYYKQAAEARNKGAYYNLGLLYYNGRGTNQNYEEAFKWFTETTKGNPKNDDTYIFVQPRDKHTNDVSTFEKREYSLQKEDFIYGKAHYYLGTMYKEGQGTQKDENEAQEHFKISI